MATIATPYDTAIPLINKADIPTWLNEYDAARVASYNLYYDIYWTKPQTFKLLQRGSEKYPIYIPSGRVICNTMDRYTATDFRPVLDPEFGTPEEQLTAKLAMDDLLSRERFGSKFEASKLSGIMKGDWFFYLTVDVEKPQFTRLSISAIDPAMVLPIEDPDDADTIWGYDIAEEILIGADTRIKRTRYLKSTAPMYSLSEPAPGGPVEYSVTAFEVQGWETAEAKTVSYDGEVAPVAMEVTTLPLYHIPNGYEVGNPFGSSEMRGIERVMAAVNQSITDEELALALEGLGMYKSDKGAPEGGVHVLGPGRVVHDETFERVNGVNTVGPFQDHLKYLHDQMDAVTGASDVATGRVDVSVAESGIALSLRMGPILSSAKKKDTTIKEVMDNMFFDLRAWFKAYEGVAMDNVRFRSTIGEKLPVDVDKRLTQLMTMYTADPPLITAAYVRDACREMGIPIPADITGQTIADERSQMMAAMDPYGERVNEEIQNEEQRPTDEDEETLETEDA